MVNEAFAVGVGSTTVLVDITKSNSHKIIEWKTKNMYSTSYVFKRYRVKWTMM